MKEGVRYPPLVESLNALEDAIERNVPKKHWSLIARLLDALSFALRGLRVKDKEEEE